MTGGSAVPPLPHWSALPAPPPGLAAVVVVPVRNEAARIGAAIDALLAQEDAAGTRLVAGSGPARVELLVLVNNTDDGSADVARAAARRHGCHRAVHVVEAILGPEQSNVGFVRRQLMDEAARRLGRANAGPHAAIASTDGDSRVLPGWLAAILDEIAHGVDAVGGRIVPDVDDPARQLPPALRRAQRLDLAHALLRARLESTWLPDEADPWPRHHQHFGASLAVTAGAYAAVGGVPAVRWLEDEALVQALRRNGMRVRHSPRVRVATSNRLDGRAEVGLAWQLRQWADPASAWRDPLVEPAQSWMRGLRGLARLRRCFEDGTRATGDLDAALDVPAGTCAALLAAGGPFPVLRDAVERHRRERLATSGGLVPLTASLAGLRAAVRALPSPPRLAPAAASRNRVDERAEAGERRVAARELAEDEAGGHEEKEFAHGAGG